MSQKTKDDFNDLLVESIGACLTTVLGVENAKAVTFYVDPHIAVADPEIYALSVTTLLGTDADAPKLFAAILADLRLRTGNPISDTKDFGEGVAEVRRRFGDRR
ncbi:MAG: hypothetical protein OK456_02155 [Thaumarchaeota archaeon]|nr:hypothetical protein [Nitrososphaerota archaeon]